MGLDYQSVIGEDVYQRAIDVFLADYNRRERHSFADCYRRLLLAASRENFAAPSEGVLRRFVGEMAVFIQPARRAGKSIYAHCCSSVGQRILKLGIWREVADPRGVFFGDADPAVITAIEQALVERNMPVAR